MPCAWVFVGDATHSGSLLPLSVHVVGLELFFQDLQQKTQALQFSINALNAAVRIFIALPVVAMECVVTPRLSVPPGWGVGTGPEESGHAGAALGAAERADGQALPPGQGLQPEQGGGHGPHGPPGRHHPRRRRRRCGAGAPCGPTAPQCVGTALACIQHFVVYQVVTLYAPFAGPQDAHGGGERGGPFDTMLHSCSLSVTT
jgi:hypothetical protein